MKKIYLIISAVALALAASSCGGGDKPSLSAKKVTKLYNEKMEELCMDKVYTTIDTGYYELNDLNARMMLQRLSHAGVITYEVERFAWYNQCTEYSYAKTKIVDYYDTCAQRKVDSKEVWEYDTVNSFNFEEHFMVDVHLTRKYMKMTVNEIPLPFDKDLQMPQYKEWTEDNLENNENWEPIAKPKIRLKHELILVGDECRKQKPQEPKAAEPEAPAKTERKVFPYCFAIDEKQAANYEIAKSKAYKGQAFILGYKLKAVKARNIKTFTIKGIHVAQCEVVVHTTKVTPQGHILMKNVIDGTPKIVNVTMYYKEDTGWDIEKMEEYDESKAMRYDVKHNAGFNSYSVVCTNDPSQNMPTIHSAHTNYEVTIDDPDGEQFESYEVEFEEVGDAPVIRNAATQPKHRGVQQINEQIKEIENDLKKEMEEAADEMQEMIDHRNEILNLENHLNNYLEQ